MANRIYLIQSESCTPTSYNPDKDILAASNYCIPVFWYALFDRSSIVAKPADLEDGTRISYPFLITTTSAAKARFAKRQVFMQVFMPPTTKGAFDDFARFLDTIEYSHIHLETLELWMMDQPEKFQRHVETCLRAFDLVQCDVPPAKLPGTKEWHELFGQVQIDPDFIEGSIKSNMLTGYSWVRPVTWRE